MKKILIVEDDPSCLKLLRDQLVEKGYQVIEALQGQAGLDAAMTNHPDLILLDIKMPVMDGLTMLSELRKDAYGKTAEVIILTNLEPDAKILQKVLKDQPTYYMVKSNIRLSQLMKKIKEVLTDK